MARKLSHIARPISNLVVAGVVSFTVSTSCAQSEPPTADLPGVIDNPFALPGEPQQVAQATAPLKPEAQPQPTTTPSSPAPAQAVSESKPKPSALRRQIAYQNPFGKVSKAPPVDTNLRPGPISRWRSPIIPGSEKSAVKAAMLSPSATPSGEPKWDVLPLGDVLRNQSAARGKETDPTFYSRLADSSSLIRFTPKPLNQPSWITGHEAQEAALPQPQPAPIHVDAAVFDVPLAASGYASQTTALQRLPATVPLPPAPSQFNKQGSVDATLAKAEVSPSIVSNCVESPAGWLEQAQNAAKSAESIEELAAVIEFCERGLREGPDEKQSNSFRRLSAWAHNRRGEMLAEGGRDEDALIDFQTAISLDPNCSLAIHNRAVTLAQQNQFTAALRDFNRVIELNPGLAVAYRNRAELLAALGRIEDAIEDYNLAIDNLPNDAQLHRDRAYAYQQLAEFSKALVDLNRAVELSPGDADALTQRGNLSAEQGNYEQAIADFQQAIAKNPNWAEAHRSLAWLEATCPNPRFQNSDDALAAAEQALKLGPENDYLILDTLAAAHASAGHFDQALNFQQRALSSAPTDAVPSLKQRLALYQNGQAFRNIAASAVDTTSIREANAEAGTQNESAR